MSMGNGGRETYGRVTVRYKIHFIEGYLFGYFLRESANLANIAEYL